MTLLLDLPHEILVHIIKQVDPVDLAPISLCCSSLYRFLQNNHLLFKELYLSNWDNPPKQGQVKFYWQDELHKLIKLRKLLESKSIKTKYDNLGFVYNAVFDSLKVAAPGDPESRNLAELRDHFTQKLNQKAFLCHSSIFDRALSSILPTAPPLKSHASANQLSAKLHCLYGVPIECLSKVYDNIENEPTYPFACSVVYDLRNYTRNTFWGPFKDDGSYYVDWEKVEAIMIVLGYNIRYSIEHKNSLLTSVWLQPFVGAMPQSYTPPVLSPLVTQLDIPLRLQDPYDITGTWARVVCFLDYNELFAYNFTRSQPTPNEPRAPLYTQEATRVLSMWLYPTKIEPPGGQDGQDFPVVYFSGTSRATHNPWEPNAVSNIRGTVRMTREGEVRWTSFSVFNGEEKWRSEGIQVGGLRSARGVMGNWFDKDYDPHGPAGPSAFWKISDNLPESEKK